MQSRSSFSLLPAVAGIALFLVTAGFSAPASRAATATERVDQTYMLAAGGRLFLENVNGRIEIDTWEREEVRLEAEKSVRARSRARAQEALAELRLDVRQTGDGIEIETRHPRSSGVLGWLTSSHVSAHVDYRLTVPTEVSLELITVNGKVAGRGPRGQLRVRTTNGDVELMEAGGTADIRTTNGSIRAELEEVTDGADLRFVTTNGGIKVELPPSIGTELEASTTNGSITTDFPVRVHGRLSRRRLIGEINGGGGRLELRTTNGSIRILEL